MCVWKSQRANSQGKEAPGKANSIQSFISISADSCISLNNTSHQNPLSHNITGGCSVSDNVDDDDDDDDDGVCVYMCVYIIIM